MSDFKNGPTQVSRHSLPVPNFIGGLSVGNLVMANSYFHDNYNDQNYYFVAPSPSVMFGKID